MGKENKVEYERVDEEGDDYRRILVKFNSHFLRGSDFEIEFIHIENSFNAGKIFVREIDSMSTIDLYRWVNRQECLMRGTGADERGTIIPQKTNLRRADVLAEAWREGVTVIEPRQVISRVKRIYELVADRFSEPTAFALNYFLFSGRLGSVPYSSTYFTIEGLKDIIEEIPYRCKNSNGEVVKQTLVEHLFDTHKTKYIVGAINIFLEGMWMAREEIIEEYGKKKEKE